MSRRRKRVRSMGMTLNEMLRAAQQIVDMLIIESDDDVELARMLLTLAAAATVAGQFFASENGLDAMAISRLARGEAQMQHERLLVSIDRAAAAINRLN